MKKEEYIEMAMAEMERYTFGEKVKSNVRFIFDRLGAHLASPDIDICAVKDALRCVVASMASRFGAELKVTYAVCVKEDGTLIDEFPTRLAAETMLNIFEEEDRLDGNYTFDFYEVVEVAKAAKED